MKTLRELTDLRGRAALITGGAGHLGLVLADALAELGANVALLDLAPEACETAATDLRRRWNVEALPVPVDLTDENRLQEVPAQVARKFGRLDILVHCAALVGTAPLPGWVAPFSEQSAATWRAALEVNLTSCFVLAKASEPLLRQHKTGTIITLGSIYGLQGPDLRLYEGLKMGNPAAYAASKGGLLQFTRWLATALAPDIRANMISCGGIERGQPASFQQRYCDRTPMQRMGVEEDFKGALAFLASDLSAYVTGQNVVVDGGWTAW